MHRLRLFAFVVTVGATISPGAADAAAAGKAGLFETTLLGTSLSVPRDYLSRTPEAPSYWIPLSASLPDLTPVADPQKRVLIPGLVPNGVAEIGLSSTNSFGDAATAAAAQCAAFACGAPLPGPAGLVMREVRQPGNVIVRSYTGEQDGQKVAFRCQTIGDRSPCYSEGDQMYGIAVSIGYDEKFLPQWAQLRARLRTRLAGWVTSQGVGPNISWQMETLRLSVPRPYLNGGTMPDRYKNITVRAISPAVSPPDQSGVPNMTISLWEAKAGNVFPNKRVWDQSFKPRLSNDAEVGPAGLIRYPDLQRATTAGARKPHEYLDGYVGKLDGNEPIYLACRDNAQPVLSHCEFSGKLGRLQASYRFPPEHLPRWREIHQNVRALIERLIVAP